MAEQFKRFLPPDFEPLKQNDIRGSYRGETPPIDSVTPITGQSRAEILIEDYNKTIEFAKWVEGLLDEELKDVVVEIDPDEQPEVWMAMQRIFASPNPKLSYKSYNQVLTALEEIDKIEYSLNDPFREEDQMIQQLTKLSEDFQEDPAPEMDILTEDTEAIEEATKIRTFTGFEDSELEDMLNKGKERLKRLRDKLRWWQNWQRLYSQGSSFAPGSKLTTKNLAVESLKTQIAALESAIINAEKNQEFEALNVILQSK